MSNTLPIRDAKLLDNSRNLPVNSSKPSSDLTRYQRYKMACRIREQIAYLREELRCSYKLTNAEHAALRRCAEATVTADDAMRRAREGQIPMSEWTRAASAARQLRRDLAKLITPYAPAVHEDA